MIDGKIIGRKTLEKLLLVSKYVFFAICMAKILMSSVFLRIQDPV